MADFIVNPRRSPRAPARCRAAVVSSTHGVFDAETEDIGSMGCQLVSPRQLRKGDLVNLVVTNELVAEPLKISGRVAWVSPVAPYRLGIAFVDGSHHDSARWFDLLLSAYPGLGGYRRVPDKIRVDQAVYLGAPPKFLLDFTAEEAMLLRAIASGARIDELRARLRDRWPAAQRALFSLIARQAITFQRGQAVHPESWKKILSDVEASLAVDEIGRGPPAVFASAPPFEPIRAPCAELYERPGPAAAGRTADPGPAAGRPIDPTPVVDLPAGDEGAPLELAGPGRAAPAPGAPPRVAADFEGAGVGWRKAHARSSEAEEAFARALVEVRAGSVNQAIALLRRALQLAPGDPEIADALGKLAFRRR